MSSRKLRAYFNYAGLARPSDRVMRRVRAAAREYAGLLFSEDGIQKYYATLEECRLAAGARLGAGEAGGVSLLTNSSTALNLAISILGATLGPGDLVITSDQEHPCVEWPLGRLHARGIEIARIAAASEGEFLEKIRVRMAARRPGFAIFSHVSYMSGRVLPVEEAGLIFAEREVPYIVDGAQALGQVAVDVIAMKAWAYAFTGHKWLFGPMGTGGLWTSAEFERRNPLAWTGPSAGHGRHGGGALESGTLNCGLIAGLAEACRACAEEFPARVAALLAMRAQISRQLDGLFENAAAKWNGPAAPGILVYLTGAGVSGADLAEAALHRHGVAIKPYRPPGEPNGFRVSYSPATTEREIELLAEAMRGLARQSR